TVLHRASRLASSSKVLEFRQAAVAIDSIGEKRENGQTLGGEPARHRHVGAAARSDRVPGAVQASRLLERLPVAHQHGIVEDRAVAPYDARHEAVADPLLQVAYRHRI